MVSFNRVILAGNLTRDPELRFTQSGTPVCGFGMAVNRVYSKNEEVDFFNVSAWRELGETVANYKKKGDPVLVEGRLQYRTWEAQDGSKRSAVDVVADRVEFLGGRADPEDGAVSRRGRTGPPRRWTRRPDAKKWISMKPTLKIFHFATLVTNH